MLSQIIASQFLASLSVMSRTTYCNLDDQRDRSLCRKDLACVTVQLARSILDSLSQDFHTVSWNPNLFSTTDVNKRILRHFSPKTLGARGANDDLCITEFCKNVHLCGTILSQGSHQKIVQLCVWKPRWQRATFSATSEFGTLGAPMAFHGSCEHRRLDCAEPVPTQQQSSPDRPRIVLIAFAH